VLAFQKDTKRIKDAIVEAASASKKKASTLDRINRYFDFDSNRTISDFEYVMRGSEISQKYLNDSVAALNKIILKRKEENALNPGVVKIINTRFGELKGSGLDELNLTTGSLQKIQNDVEKHLENLETDFNTMEALESSIMRGNSIVSHLKFNPKKYPGMLKKYSAEVAQLEESPWSSALGDIAKKTRLF
jgi:DNA repair ATPase RecN